LPNSRLKFASKFNDQVRDDNFPDLCRAKLPRRLTLEKVVLSQYFGTPYLLPQSPQLQREMAKTEKNGPERYEARSTALTAKPLEIFV
jgi:hypothetical protein